MIGCDKICEYFIATNSYQPENKKTTSAEVVLNAARTYIAVPAAPANHH